MAKMCGEVWEKEERRCIFLFLQSINQSNRIKRRDVDPNRISTYYVLGVLVLKNKGGVFLRGIN